MKKTVFLYEVTTPIAELKILKESKDANGNHKLKIKACLQTANEKNINNRIYTKEAINNGIESISERIKNRRFLGELDHPAGNDLSRQTQVYLKEASHLITSLYWDGDMLLGDVETLATPNGKIMTSLIKENIPVGFSVRALGNAIKKEGVDVIDKQMKIISYDCVSNPSHAKAVTLEVKKENVNLLTEAGKIYFGGYKQSDLIRILKENTVDSRISNIIDRYIEQIFK